MRISGLRYVLGGCAIVIAGVVLVVALRARVATPSAIVTAEPSVHYSNDSSIPIHTIRIKAFYFLPADYVSSTALKAFLESDAWRAPLTDGLSRLKEFWTFQFYGGATINFDMHSTAVVGRESRAFYDGERTEGGNPNGLRAVKAELIARVFTPGGDLYDKQFAGFSDDEYKVMSILYEGVGATGSGLAVAQAEDNAVMSEDEDASGTVAVAPVIDRTEFPTFFVSRSYLTDESFKGFGPSIFAHEFGHALGLPDFYSYDAEEKTEVLSADDIMGAGRYRPLEATYLGESSKARLGVTY